MSVSYTIYEAIGLVRCVASPPYTLVDAADYIRALANDKQFRPGFHELVDLRKLDSCEFTYEQMGGLIREQADLMEKRGNGALAFLVSSPTMYGMCRMCQIMATGMPVRISVFWEEEEALDFLADPSDYARSSQTISSVYPICEN